VTWLLRQPRGLEGLGLVAVVGHLDDLSVGAPLGELPEQSGHGGAAFIAVSADPEGGERPIAQVAYIYRLSSPVGEDSEQVAPPLTSSVVPW
jgi:hypothetical protein